MTQTAPGDEDQAPPEPAGCPVCGAVGTMRAVQNDITIKRRPKFGVFWILLTIFTGGFGLILWLIWPRLNEVVGIDGYLQCTNCNARVA